MAPSGRTGVGRTAQATSSGRSSGSLLRPWMIQRKAGYSVAGGPESGCTGDLQKDGGCWRAAAAIAGRTTAMMASGSELTGSRTGARMAKTGAGLRKTGLIKA